MIKQNGEGVKKFLMSASRGLVLLCKRKKSAGIAGAV